MTRWVAIVLGLTALIGRCDQAHTQGPTQRTRAESAANTPKPLAATTAPSPATEDRGEAAQQPKTRVIAYYFHRTIRCPTCLSIEKQAREAVETMYPDQLAAGKLEWHAVNIETPGNEHFETDFELEASSLVLVQMRGDKVVRWANLPRVWDLAHDPVGFQEYVWTELAQFAEF